MFGRPPTRSEYLDGGIVLQLTSSTLTSCEMLAAVSKLAGEALALPAGYVVNVSSQQETSTKLVPWGAVTTSYVLDRVGEIDWILLTGFGSDATVNASVRLLESGQLSGVLRAYVRHRATEESVSVCSRVLGMLDQLPVGLEVVSGGIEAAAEFDAQHESLMPFARIDANWWSDYIDKDMCCGYYWTTILGPELLSKLEEVPKSLSNLFRVENGVGYVQLGADPLDDATIRSLIPELRQWLRPVLSDWMVSRPRREWSVRLFEGPPVPFMMACIIRRMWTEDVSFEECFGQTIRDVFEIEGDALQTGEFRLVVTTDPAQVQAAFEGLLGCLAAVDRGHSDGWFNVDSNVAWGVISRDEYVLSVDVKVTGTDVDRSLNFLFGALHIDFSRATREGLATYFKEISVRL